MQKKKVLWAVTLAVTLTILTALVLLLRSTGFFEAARSQEGLRQYIERYTPHSHLVFFALQLSSVILAPIPSNVIAVVGGLLFGAIPAFLLTTGAVLLGSAIVFTLGRALGRPFAEHFVSRGKLEKYTEVIRQKRNTFFFLAFLFPFFPDDLLCIVAGLTDIPFGQFFLLVVLARPWGLLVASALGGSALSIPAWGMVLLGAAALALFLLALKYGDRLEATLINRLKKED
ncbi:MAG: VTT domain-containing protein [Pseudoflavonifractor sp.]|nr:VTT domain-containing protein [Pseudoflavonifractor sp.]